MRRDRGVALLEALVALTIVAATSLGVTGLLAAGLRAERDAARRERELAAAHRIIAAHALLAVEDLERRIGRHQAGDLIVSVQRPERGLFRIAVARSDTPHVEELVTVVHRFGGSL